MVVQGAYCRCRVSGLGFQGLRVSGLDFNPFPRILEHPFKKAAPKPERVPVPSKTSTETGAGGGRGAGKPEAET